MIALVERPRVVLMDVRMPDLDGIEATARICAATTDIRVLILTTSAHRRLQRSAARRPDDPPQSGGSDRA